MTARRAAEDRRRRPAPRRSVPLPRGAAIAIGAVVVLLLIVLVARGCGDDALSAGELRSQAGAICARANAITDRVAVPNAPSGGQRFLREGLAELRPAHMRLAALKPPDELRADYERAVALNLQQLALIGRTSRAIAGGADTIDAFAALQRRLAPVLAQENAAWRALDVPACMRQ